MGILIDSSVLVAAERVSLDLDTLLGCHGRDLRSFPRIRGLRVLRW